MRHVNLNKPEFVYDDADPDGFRAGMWRFGEALGARRTGTTVYEIPPGQAVCPYHYEHGEEEWALVLDGEVTLRDPDGERQLAPMDLVFFPPGPDGAHQLRNDSDAPARVIMWSENVMPGATTYPDSDKIGIWSDSEPDGVLFRRSSAVDYFDGETSDQR